MASASATDSPPLLRFYAINAGYNDGANSQNADFIELERLTDSNLDLSAYRIAYTNSSGNPAGEVVFAENLLLTTDHLLLGASVNPQFSTVDGSYYVYNFGSAGLASTAGKLELYQGEHIIDEICWGKLECSSSHAKFATKPDDNYSLVRCPGICSEGYELQKYYPEPTFSSIIENIPTEPEPEPEPSCGGVIITEVFSYYTESISEQFIELYNPTAESVPLATCSLHYKNSRFPLTDMLAPGAYYVFQNPDLALTKNPTSSNLITVEDASGAIIASINYPHGQKKGTSYALLDVTLDTAFWRQTYFPTPGLANIYQEFQTCPSGKVINPASGNCVKEETPSIITCPAGKYLNPLTNRCKKIAETTSALTPCREGYERNPETNRCRKITAASTKLTPCKDGYERNSETNRCRKIRENVGETTDYAPTPPEESKSYQNPKIFIAIIALIIAVLIGVVYVIYQYRQEIHKLFRNFVSRFRKV